MYLLAEGSKSPGTSRKYTTAPRAVSTLGARKATTYQRTLPRMRGRQPIEAPPPVTARVMSADASGANIQSESVIDHAESDWSTRQPVVEPSTN
jgi:hypothetical protein